MEMENNLMSSSSAKDENINNINNINNSNKNSGPSSSLVEEENISNNNGIISNNPKPHVVKEENISNNLRPVKEETNNNCRPVKKEENNADSGDWRAETTMEYRQRLRNSILESRLWIFPNIAPEKMNDMKQTVEEFEERCFSNCTTKEYYINRLQSTITIRDINLHTIVEAKATPSASSHSKRNSTNSAFQGIQSQQCNERKPLPTSLPKSMPYLPQQQQLPSHSMQNTIASAGVQSTSLPSPLSYGTSLMDTTVLNGAGQSCNMLQSLTGYSTGQCAPSNIFASSQKMQVRQNANPMVVQQQSQSAQQFIYPQQLQNQIAKQIQYGSSTIQPQMNHNYQQLHQQTIQQTSQLQSSQQAFIQAPPSLHSSRPSPHQTTTTQSFAQSSANSVHQQHQQTSIQMRPNVLQQNSQFIRQQQQLRVQQQKTLLGQQSKLSSHQNQHLMVNGSDETNIQSELLGEHCNIADLQQQQLQQQQETEWCIGGEQSNQSRMQQQIMINQNVISNFHEQQLGGQCNVSGFHQKNKQISSRMSGSPQQPTMSQPQMRPAQLQKQNSLQRDTPYILHSSSALLQPQNATEQQKQLIQWQNMPPEASSDSVAPTRQTSIVHEELLHKIREMNELYLPPLLDIYKVVTKLVQNGKPDHTDSTKTKNFKSWLEHVINVLQNPERFASSECKDRIMHMERNIIANVKMHRKFQQRQSGDHSSRAQMTQLQHQYSQISTQMQPRNSKLSVVSMQQTAVSNMQHDLPPSLSTQFGMPVVQPSMINTLQPSYNMEISHGNGQSSFQQGVVQSPQKFIHNATKDMRLNVTSQNDRLLQPNMGKHLKMQDQQMIKTQKQQFQQHQMSRQEQQIMQQQLQQNQQQQQQNARQIAPSYQLDEITNLKGKQGMTAKLGVLHQQHTAAQHFAYHHQPLKAGVSFRVSSPLSIQAGSPQVSQISSPQTDQQSMMTTGSKAGTPLQLSNSLLVTPSPSTPLTPSTVPVEHEKQSSGVSSHSNAANSGQIQPVTALHQAQSLVIDTPGISTSPLLSPEDDPGTAPAIVCSKSSATQRSIERLINAVKSISQKSLSASVNDISSVVSLVDKLGGSGHGPGHRACVGDDLVARAKQNVLEKVISEDEIVMTKRKTLHSDFIFQNTLSAADSFIDNFKQLNGLETSDLESTATSRIKRPRCEVINALVEEIQQINRHLINTKVDICDEDARLAAPIDEDGEGTIVKCSFTALGVQLPVLSVCLLVPVNYPNCSPALLDKMPLELSTVAEDLLVKATSCFKRSLRCLSQPMTLGEMANTWDACARAVIMEYAEQNGGGSFSKRYGTWQHCVSAN